SRIEKRLKTKYCDVMTDSIDEAVMLANEAKAEGKPLSIALVGNAAEVHFKLLEKNIKIDIVTDQTSAHDPLNGYIPIGYTVEEAEVHRKYYAEKYMALAKKSMAKHVEAMLT